MRLKLNIFVLFLISYVKGQMNFLHEVYVVPKLTYGSDPRAGSVIGCVIKNGHEVLVPSFPNPDTEIPTFHIQYTDSKGNKEVYMDIVSYQETNSASLLILKPEKPIPMSKYTKAADIYQGNFVEHFCAIFSRLSSEVAHVNSMENLFAVTEKNTFTMGEIDIQSNKNERTSDILKEGRIDHLRKGATLFFPPNDQHKVPIVVAMYQKHILLDQHNAEGTMIFNIVDTETTKIVTSPAASDTDKDAH